MIDSFNFDNYSKNIDKSKFIKIDCASSQSIPLPNSFIDLVVTSPPYCTRIDYAVATSPELALLGCSMKKDLKALTGGEPLTNNLAHHF
jgi:DNA modification methylase